MESMPAFSKKLSTDDVDIDAASEFVCKMYGQSNNTNDVNEARYNKLLMMSGKFSQVDICLPLNIRKSM